MTILDRIVEINTLDRLEYLLTECPFLSPLIIPMISSVLARVFGSKSSILARSCTLNLLTCGIDLYIYPEVTRPIISLQV